MKIKNILLLTFTIVGTVTGAGFISGRELIRFFGGSFLLPSVFLAFLLFFFLTVLFLSAGRNQRIMKKADNKFWKTVILLSNFVILSAMLAGIDSLFAPVTPFPVFSLLTLLLLNLSVNRGIGKIAIINLVFMPCVLVFIFFFLLKDFSFDLLTSMSGNGNIALVYSYAAMNIFLAVPVLYECGKKFSKKECLIGAFCAAFLICTAVFIILSALKPETHNLDMPLMSVFSSGALIVFSILVYFAIFTTAVSAYFPLYNFSNKKRIRFIFCAAAFILSRLGLIHIVDIMYPFLGLLGGVYTIIVYRYSLKFGKVGN